MKFRGTTTAPIFITAMQVNHISIRLDMSTITRSPFFTPRSSSRTWAIRSVNSFHWM